MMFHPGMMRLAKGTHGTLALCIALGLLVSGTSIWRGFLTAGVIDGVFAGEAFSSLTSALMLIFALALAIALFSWLRRGAEMWVAASVKQHLRPRLFAKLASLGPGTTARLGTGKAQAALVDGVEALEGYFGSYVPQVLITLTVPGLVLIYLFTIDPWVGGALALAVAMALWAPKMWERLLGKYGQEHWDAYSALNKQFIDSMQGMTTLVSFNAAHRRGTLLKEKAHSLYRATMRQLAVSLMGTGMVGLAMKGGSALALGIAVVRMSQGHISLESLLIILFLTGECIGPLSDLDRAWHAGYMGISASKGIFEILDKQAEIKSQPQNAAEMIRLAQPEIVFDDVSFAYDQQEGKVLEKVSITLRPGETTALAGPSGAGKTTIAALLMRFAEGEGNIHINGVSIDQIPLAELHANMALVSQETYLFYGTVADNLRLAMQDASQEQLETAAKAANAHQFIRELPQGYDTMIGERGQKLSGGEKQRLAIARALLADAPILILDEATASVDAANERQIQEALANAARSRTTLVIAHRLNTICNADRIYVLDQGRIVEQGRHQELLQHQGIYARLAAEGAA